MSEFRNVKITNAIMFHNVLLLCCQTLNLCLVSCLEEQFGLLPVLLIDTAGLDAGQRSPPPRSKRAQQG